MRVRALDRIIQESLLYEHRVGIFQLVVWRQPATVLVFHSPSKNKLLSG